MQTTKSKTSRRSAWRNYFRLVRYVRAYCLDDPTYLIRQQKRDTSTDHASAEQVVSVIVPSLPPTPEIPPSNATSELVGIASRCSVKANGCTWASERLRLQNAGANHQTEIAPNDASIVEQGRQHQVRLWMNCPSAPAPYDPTEYDTLAGCFAALASATNLVTLVESSDSTRSSHLRHAMALMAEAQSMVRACSKRIGGPTDSEQSAAYSWLCQRAAEARLFIERYMRADDQANPEEWHDLLDRISESECKVNEIIKNEKSQRKLLNKLSYMLGQLEKQAEPQTQLVAIDRTVSDLIDNGLAPSNIELRGLLLPHLAAISNTKQKSSGLELALREIRRFCERADMPDQCAKPDNLSREVLQVAELLQGRSIAMIGGDCRPETKRSIEKAFGLRELVWVDTKQGQSYQTFKPVVERKDVAVVLLAIRWVAHSYGEVIRFCTDNDKPFVRLPAGYSPNQIANQILSQCGDQLLRQTQQEGSGT
ncbi:hypothetical protein FYK55_27975 [Roseiconus nitratireducens]|uniref:DUF2325 domain-containing protein n=1 Tax=Roseiconus nitratireducens TaxID=2605748 RepID=A0A5M6CS18_9BACT|nr:hypothetical protein [Roseiconus nitratireducens]KAA5537984.1 hypothetical protein FYK55_27975 [Roseiconus nitratireducens]